MLREPVDLEVGMELAQLVRDRDVALRVPEPDRRGDVERALASRLSPDPARCGLRRRDEVAQQEIDLDRIPKMWRVPGSLEHDEVATRLLGERRTPRVRRDRVAFTMDDEHGAADVPAQLPRLVRGQAGPFVCRDERFAVCL